MMYGMPGGIVDSVLSGAIRYFEVFFGIVAQMVMVRVSVASAATKEHHLWCAAFYRRDLACIVHKFGHLSISVELDGK